MAPEITMSVRSARRFRCQHLGGAGFMASGGRTVASSRISVALVFMAVGEILKQLQQARLALASGGVCSSPRVVRGQDVGRRGGGGGSTVNRKQENNTQSNKLS